MKEKAFGVELTQGADDDLKTIHHYLAEHRSATRPSRCSMHSLRDLHTGALP